MSKADKEGSDQPVYPDSLISAFVIRSFDGIRMDATPKIPRHNS